MTTERPATRALKTWKSQPVDIAGELAAYRREGLAWFESLAGFLAAYSGLTIGFRSDDGRPDTIWFSGRRSVELIATAWIEDYSRRAGVLLAPVGAAYSDHLTLLIGEDGSWFGGYGEDFGSLGADFPAALDNLLQNAGFRRAEVTGARGRVNRRDRG